MVGKRFLLTWLATILLVMSVDVVVRNVRGTRTLPYEIGVRAYRGFVPEILEEGVAPVAIVGSSRSRAGFLSPVLAETWSLARGSHGVANYAMSGARAADVALIVRRLLEVRPPRLLLYGLTPLQLATDVAPLSGKESLLWRPSDWWSARAEHGRSADRLLPFAITNELSRRSLLVSMRAELQDALRAKGAYGLWERTRLLADARPSVFNPRRGDLPFDQTGPRGNESLKVDDQQVVAYLGNRYREHDWPRSWQLPWIRTLIQAAGAVGTTVVLVEVPVSPMLQQRYPPRALSTFRDTIATLAKDEGVRFLTLDELGVSFTQSQFREHSHLNARGAVPYSQAVARALRPTVDAIVER